MRRRGAPRECVSTIIFTVNEIFSGCIGCKQDFQSHGLLYDLLRRIFSFTAAHITVLRETSYSLVSIVFTIDVRNLHINGRHYIFKVRYTSDFVVEDFKIRTINGRSC